MATYSLEPSAEVLHGYFSRDLPPVLTIDSGDTVRFRTLDAGWNATPMFSPYDPAKANKFGPVAKEHYDGHALIGPLYINGAAAGMTLEVQINAIQTGGWGWTLADYPNYHLWTLDDGAMIARNQHGHTVRMRPFMGVMGVAPAEAGQHNTIPPRAVGGNLDCKELVAGTRLFLPVAVEGALFSVGDGHAAQGDGEAHGTAIECPIERVELTFHLHPELSIAYPRAWTPEAWLTFGFHEDLDEAVKIALDGMIALMCERFALQAADARALASLAVDLRITQIVNGAKGVHAVLPHGAVRLGQQPT